MSDAVAVGLLAALIWKITDFLKHLTNRDLSATVTQLVAWTAGFVAVLLFAHSSVASYVVVHGINFSHASWVDQLLIGLTIGSSGSGLYDFKRAIDSGDSAAMPPLIPTPATPVTSDAPVAPAARVRTPRAKRSSAGYTLLELIALVLLIAGVILLLVPAFEGDQTIAPYVPGIVLTATGLVMVLLERSGARL